MCCLFVAYCFALNHSFLSLFVCLCLCESLSFVCVDDVIVVVVVKVPNKVLVGGTALLVVAVVPLDVVLW